MANTHLAYPDLALDKLSGTDPDQDAESLVQLIERKINFALGDAPADPDDLVSYTFRKKALLSSLLRGTAAEWYESNIENATTCAATRKQFITRFSNGRNKFRHRMEVEHCVRGDGEEIRNFLHRIKKIVDKGWPDDMEGIAEGDGAAEDQAQGRQRRQRYIDYTLRGLRPRYLQRKAQEYLMERPNATWNDFSTRIIQRDVSYQFSSNFLNDEEQTKVQTASLGKDMKKLCSELQEHRVNALENTRQPDPNHKGRQNATRFCNYCRTTGHTPSWCRKKIRDEEIKRIQNGMVAEKRVTFTNDYNKRRGPSHGSGQFTYNNPGNRYQAGRTYLIHNSRTTMELRSSTHEVIGGIPPETTYSTLVVDDRLIDIRISSLDGMTTKITGPTTPEPRQEEPGRTLELTHVLLLVRDEIHRKVDSISPCGLVHLTSR